ncbi:hypothetical protein J2Y58_000772 [Sphingomonas sp. BE138]|uniref:DUF6356 family protein n=1 Tax=Sphingomonas sp. BE138 TaxID=2817845 RepID=UPI002861E703|nr:DUF6356 family protein [Sphingomonas sp. BE138]MDR6787431.1 hypothetical protein [Sphingomonas sp. BE138]
MRRLTASLDTIFTAHPRAVGESYFAHARTAAGFGLTMIGGGIACTIHGLVPALFTTTGSDTVRHLHARMTRRAREAQEAGLFCYEI